MIYGYINTKRIGNVDNHLKELEEYKPEKIFIEENSSEEIPAKLSELISILNDRDEIVVHSCLTLSDDEDTLQKIIAKVRSKGGKVRFIDLSAYGMENPIEKRRKALIKARQKG